ncbi:hypothetical protein JXB11_00830, partial [Candidatus Woesearchaeota archaeon]|nr:hypothetical protein [Candidatus Woesearchaeota archaeon]
MKPKKDLTQGSISKNLLWLALPVVGGMFMQNLFILVDTFFVAKLGSDAIAAIAASFPAFFIIIALASGLNVGVSSFVARSIGAKKYPLVNSIAENGLILGAVLGILVTVIGLLSGTLIVNLMGVTESVGSLMNQYISWIYIGSFTFFLGHAANGVLHGEGDTKTPMKGFILG